MKTRLLLLALLIAFLAGGASLYRYVIHRYAINRESFDRITLGMTYEQVVEIIGVEPGDHRPCGHFENDHHSVPVPPAFWWLGSNASLHVVFDEEYLVKEFAYLGPHGEVLRKK